MIIIIDEWLPVVLDNFIVLYKCTLVSLCSRMLSSLSFVYLLY